MLGLIPGLRDHEEFVLNKKITTLLLLVTSMQPTFRAVLPVFKYDSTQDLPASPQPPFVLLIVVKPKFKGDCCFLRLGF